MADKFTVKDRSPNHWNILKNDKDVVVILRGAGEHRWIILDGGNRVGTLTKSNTGRYFIDQNESFETIGDVGKHLDANKG